MNIKTSSLFLICFSTFIFINTQAFEKDGVYFGAGYLSQNSFGMIAQKEDGSSGFLGEASYPLLFKYDYNVSSDWYLSPQLGYTPLARQTPGNTAKVTVTQLLLNFGRNFADNMSTKFDWYLGAGILRYSIQGAGGTTVMNNGTSTATFAVPGGNSTVQKIILNIGGSFSYEHSRFGLDIIFENLLSSKKRTEDLMFSYTYRFGGGYF